MGISSIFTKKSLTIFPALVASFLSQPDVPRVGWSGTILGVFLHQMSMIHLTKASHTDPAEKKHEKNQRTKWKFGAKMVRRLDKKKVGADDVDVPYQQKIMENLSFTLRNHWNRSFILEMSLFIIYSQYPIISSNKQTRQLLLCVLFPPGRLVWWKL